MKKNVAGQFTGAQMVSATDGSAFTGTVSVFVTIDNGSQAAGSGTVTHKGNGFHSYAPTQAETNGDRVAFTFTGTGAVPATAHHFTTFPQTGDSFARLGAPAGASVAADIADLPTNAELASALAAADDAVLAAIAALSIPTAIENADAILARDIGSGSNAGSLNERTVRSALRFLRNKWSISGTTLTVTKEDDAASAWTATVTAAPGADPISGNDPA